MSEKAPTERQYMEPYDDDLVVGQAYRPNGDVISKMRQDYKEAEGDYQEIKEDAEHKNEILSLLEDEFIDPLLREYRDFFPIEVKVRKMVPYHGDELTVIPDNLPHRLSIQVEEETYINSIFDYLELTQNGEEIYPTDNSDYKQARQLIQGLKKAVETIRGASAVKRGIVSSKEERDEFNENMANAKDKRDATLWRAREDFKDNEEEYKAVAKRDAEADGVEIEISDEAKEQ